MKKRNKARLNGATAWIMWFITLVIGIGIGSLFTGGTFLNAVILNWLPTMAHTVIGWVIIVGSVWNAISRFF